MSQNIFTTIDPSISGTDLATLLNDFKDALVSGLSGTSRPAELQAGGGWIDTTNDPTSWSYKVYTGVADVQVFVLDLVNGSASVSQAVDSFIIRKISADTVGAILNLVKRRIATNGQVLSGDVVGEIRVVGRDDVGADPIVAKIVFDAAENMTASAYGGTLTFYSTPQGQAALVAHMRFIGGIFETIVPHKTNALILSGQNVATAASIAQLSGDKVLVEMTGATATNIHGIDATDFSKVVSIHNRSSAIVTVKHQSVTASAVDRILLPSSKDIALDPQESVTLFYCTADSRWKIQYASSKFNGFTVDTSFGVAGSWVAPASVSKARVIAFPKRVEMSSSGLILDVGKSAFMWGLNGNGQLGLGDVTPRSSPVAVLGGLRFVKVEKSRGPFALSTGLTYSGLVYAWGNNLNGELGVGDVVPRSSPVAVLGGLKFKTIGTGYNNNFGLNSSGDVYAWGGNLQGTLGVGDVAPRSSPVAVLGGLKFREIFCDLFCTIATTFTGVAYAWGANSGQLGLGDLTPRSSPVAVLGGLKFRTIAFGSGAANQGSVFGLTESGDIYSWGLNFNGVLGLGDFNVSRSSPELVIGGLKYKSLSVATVLSSEILVATTAITTAGDAYAWGYNANGQLGVGDVNSRSSPVAVLGGLKFKKVVHGTASTFGITEDGILYAWGLNANGQLGLGDVIPRSSPVAVLGGLTFQDVTGDASVLAVTTDGVLYSWGLNTNGQLGLGDVTPRSSPVAVLSGLSIPSQDDNTTMIDIPIVGGDTYVIKMGVGPCFFGNKPIGNDIEKVEIVYIG